MDKITRGGFAHPGTALDFKTGTWRLQRPTHLHEAAPCHGACPAGEDAQAYLALMQAGKPREAWETLVGVNPLPAVTGRVCFHPCERACNRGQPSRPLLPLSCALLRFPRVHAPSLLPVPWPGLRHAPFLRLPPWP